MDFFTKKFLSFSFAVRILTVLGESWLPRGLARLELGIFAPLALMCKINHIIF